MSDHFSDMVKDILDKHGWKFHRHGKGSHEIWTNGTRIVSVPNSTKSRQTANKILKKQI